MSSNAELHMAAQKLIDTSLRENGFDGPGLAWAVSQVTRSLVSAGLLVDEDVFEVLTYVSSGRGYVGVTPYPDFQARRALGRIRDV